MTRRIYFRLWISLSPSNSDALNAVIFGAMLDLSDKCSIGFGSDPYSDIERAIDV